PRTRWKGVTPCARLSNALHQHQASFREAVITAYSGRCALSGLPEPLLLDAAHIVPNKDEQLGQPVVPNGIPLSKIHHAAFDVHLIGIDPDYRLNVSKRLLGQHDGRCSRPCSGLMAEPSPGRSASRTGRIVTVLHSALSASRWWRKVSAFARYIGIDYS